MMSIGALGVVTVTWALVGYSLAFAKGNWLHRRASVTRCCTALRSRRARAPSIPQLLFMAFEAGFCIITAALVSGAIVERMRFELIPGLHGAVVGTRLPRARALGLGRRLAAAARDPRFRRRRASRDGLRILGIRGCDSSSVRERTTAAKRYCRTTRSTCCSARVCCGSAGLASTAGAATRRATAACSRSRTRC